MTGKPENDSAFITDPEFILNDHYGEDQVERGDIHKAREWAKKALGRDMAAGWFVLDGGHRWRAWELKSLAWGTFDSFVENPNGGLMRRNAWDQGIIRKLIEDADKGDAGAHQAVCDIIADHLTTETPQPPLLRKFLLELLHGTRSKPPPSRGWDRGANDSRDVCISLAVWTLENRGGFSRTRNPGTDAPCACSIVAEVLGELGISLSEKRVSQITSQKVK